MKRMPGNAMSKEGGFSLIELLFVVSIIAIILAIAVPHLSRARQQASAGSAVQSLRTITTAQNQYENTAKVYATLETLASEKLIDSQLAGGSKSGYSFTLGLGPKAKSFTCRATPSWPSADSIHFFVDQTSVIRSSIGAPANANSDPIQ